MSGETTRLYWCRGCSRNVPAEEAETHACETTQPIRSPQVRNHRKRDKKPRRKQGWKFQGLAGRPSVSERWPGG